MTTRTPMVAGIASLLTAGVMACNGNSKTEPNLDVAIADRTSETSIEASASNSKWVMGYYVGYLANVQPVSAIDWRGLTHIAVGIILPNPDGSLDLNNSIVPNAAGRAELIRAAHARGRKAIAMIGGEGTGPSWTVAASDANRTKFVANLKKLVGKNGEGFDGLDIDWEPLETSDRPLLLQLVKDLRTQLPKAILTFPAGSDNANLPEDHTFYASLAPYLDQINLMTYGMAGAYDGWKTWHSSALYASGDSSAPTSIDETVNNFLQANVPASKLGIGIGAYGQCFGAPASAPLQPTIGLQAGGAALLAGDNEMSYAKIVTQYAPTGTRNWDATARVPYLSFTQPSGPKGCTYITYDDPQSIKEKANYVKARGLGGVIIWNINEGYIPNRSPNNPLLNATRKAFSIR